MKTLLFINLFLLTTIFTLFSQETISLFPPTDNGVSVIKALQNRHTCRKYQDKDLTIQDLSNLLWCANGENRSKTHKRTAPSAWNIKVIDIYIALKTGVYIYNPEKHILERYLQADIRKNTGTQDFVGIAPAELIYVANYDRNNEKSMGNKKFYATSDASHISENVYIYCASAELGTVVRDLVPREKLAELLKLKENQAIILAQTVGYPVK